jgi:hypothetical protein
MKLKAMLTTHSLLLIEMFAGLKSGELAIFPQFIC